MIKITQTSEIQEEDVKCVWENERGGKPFHLHYMHGKKHIRVEISTQEALMITGRMELYWKGISERIKKRNEQ